MFERVLHQVLTESLEQLLEQPTALQAFLDTLPLDAVLGEPAAVRDLIRSFAQQTRPVIHGYARAETAFPVWAIVLAGEQEDLRALGDESADDDDRGQPVMASVWNSNYQILVYSQAPDVTLYLYQLVRAILLTRRHELIRRAGLMNISTIQGAELSPDQLYLPEFLWVRVASLTAVAEQRGISLLGPPPGQAQDLPPRTILGVHVHDPRVSDGTRHLVTTYEPEE